MNHDCGLITGSKSLDWVRACNNETTVPENVRYELYTLLNTPGFTQGYFARAFQRSLAWVFDASQRARARLNIDEAAANWSSITRDDALALARLRTGSGSMPVICRVYIAEDLTTGKRHSVIAREWGVTPTALQRIVRLGPFFDARLPDWFRARIPT